MRQNELSSAIITPYVPHFHTCCIGKRVEKKKTFLILDFGTSSIWCLDFKMLHILSFEFCLNLFSMFQNVTLDLRFEFFFNLVPRWQDIYF